MKKIVLGSLILTFLSIFYFSCKKSTIYSCNPEAQTYAINNLELNQNISRDSLSKLDLDFQFAVFRSLTNRNKLRIFREKIDLVLNSVEELNIDEKNALIYLRDNAPEEIYGNNNDNVHPFINSWDSMARNELGWTDTAIQIFVGTWNAPSELRNKQFNSPSQSGVADCGCRSRWGCAGFGYCDWESGCDETKEGCGIMGGAKCKGTCPEIVEPNGSSSQIYLPSKYEF